jgi:phage terminase large subunit-like protein
VEDIRRGDGPKVIRRLEALCTISKDGFAARAGEPLVLRAWQKQLLLRLFARRADGRRRHRVALIGMPRKNGKSALGSGLALDGLLFDGQGAEVYSAAAEKEQARIVFGETKRMVQAKADLLEACTVMRDVIEVPATNSLYRVLSAEAYSKEGLNISRALVDELHAHATDDLWNVLTLASAARLDPLVAAITTAGVTKDRLGNDSVCYRLFRYGVDIAEGRIDDPSFFMAWWGAPHGADHLDPEVWRAANPGFDDLIDPEDFASSVRRTPEPEFRTKRLNQWVESAVAWFRVGVFEACLENIRIEDGEPVVLGFDGSYSGDSTALLAVTLGDCPHVSVVHCWENRDAEDHGWRVPRGDVLATIRAACDRWQVLEIAADEHIWVHELQQLADEGLPVVKYPQTGQGMIEATQRVYERVIDGGLTHDGDEDLVRHVTNAVLKTDSRGSRLTKDRVNSKRHIDLAVAMVMAVDRAAVLSSGQFATVLYASDEVPAEPDGPEVGVQYPRMLSQEDVTECFACKVGGCTIHG